MTRWFKIGILISPFCVNINRNLNATELDKIETEKQPSASVNPANQLLVRSGKIVEGIKSILFNFILPFEHQILKPSMKLLNKFCLLGKTKLPLNK